MTKTVVGLFDSYNAAQDTVQELIDNGISASDISVVANNSSGAIQTQTGTDVGNESAAADGAGAGAVGGTVVGGVLGLLVGLGALAIPGIGPVIAAGPLSAAIGSAAAAIGVGALGAGIGAAGGGLLGALIGSGVPEEDANLYSEGVRRGGTLVTVSASDDMAATAQSIMQRHNVVNIDERGSSLRSGGWDRFNPDDTTPYTGSATSGTYTGGSRSYERTAANVEHSVDARANEVGNNWKESSKVGTAGGTAAGAATGAAIGSVGGPVGTVVGGIAGAVTGAGVGAAGDAAGEAAKDAGYFDNDYFRSDYDANYASSGYGYDRYEPAYRYGYDLAADPTYSGRQWYDIENDVRTGWDTNRYGSWESFKDAVRRGWERTRGVA